MPQSVNSRRPFATRSTLCTDFSPVVRHAERQHLSDRYAGRNLPSGPSSLGGPRMMAASFGGNYVALALRLAARPVVSRFPMKGGGPAVAPSVEPRFGALTVFIILARIAFVLWLGTRLGGLVLEGAARTLWDAGLNYGRRWLEERPAGMAGLAANGEDSDAYAEVEEQCGATAV